MLKILKVVLLLLIVLAISYTTAAPLQQDEDPEPVYEGAVIAFLSTRDAPAGEEMTELYIMRPDGSDVRRLTYLEQNIANFNWSPDGQYIYLDVAKEPFGTDAYRIDADGYNLTPISSETFFINNIHWSPTGDQLVANTAEGVTILDAEMNTVRVIAEFPESFDNVPDMPDWSYGGNIAYITFQLASAEPRFDVWVVSAEGEAEPVNITKDNFDVTNATALDWSPVEEQLVLSSLVRGVEDIFLMDASGDNVVNITSHGASDGQPDWSPDGEVIAFVSNRSGNYDIFSMNADGSEVVQLTDHPATDTSPAWSPPGVDYVITAAEFCTVTAKERVNKRTGPGTSFAGEGQLAASETAEVIRRTFAENATWYQLRDETWVRSDLVTGEPACSHVPLVEVE